MKKYISAVLIPCLLMQLYGCYTFKTIQNDEIEKFYQDKKIIIKTTDQKEFILQKNVSSEEILRNQNTEYCTEYEVLQDSLFLLKKKVGNIRTDETGSTIKTIQADSIFIKNDLISEIGFRKVSPWSYAGWGVLTGILIGGIAGFIAGDDEAGFFHLKAEEKALLVGSILGAAGGIIGLISGIISSTDD